MPARRVQSVEASFVLEITMVDDDGVRGSLMLDADKVRRFTSVSPKIISISERFRPERRQVEVFLEQAYARAFGGELRRHYPILMSVWDASGELHAAAGFRFAAREPLFLEQYLDQPVERAIGEGYNTPVARSSVAEIGNLASSSPGASVFLFLALAGYLDQQGCRFATATATKQLRRIFRRVGFNTLPLAKASPERLQAGPDQWGRYYDNDPVVLAGEVRPSFDPLQRSLAADPAPETERLPRLHFPVDVSCT